MGMRKIGIGLMICMVGLLIFTGCNSSYNDLEERNADNIQSQNADHKNSGDESTQSVEIEQNISSEKDNNAVDETGERIKLVLDLGPLLEDQSVLAALDEVQTLEQFSYIDFEIRDNDPDYWNKMPIAVSNGEYIDIVAVANSIRRTTLAENKIIIPLNGYLEMLDYDFEEAYGDHTKNAKVDDYIYIIPQRRTVWILYYNKDIFDEARVPYPSEVIPMTWDEYTSTAKLLTSGKGDEKVYGAFYQTWPIFWYGEAIQTIGTERPFYTEDGMSNIEDPAFAKGLQRYYDMMHVDKSIPLYSDLVIEKISPQAYMTGKYGMMISGSWVLNWSMDKELFPRDWRIGVAPLPVDDSEEYKSWGDTDGFAVAATSRHAKEAVEVSVALSELCAKHAISNAPSNQIVSSSQLYAKAEELLEEDDISAELLRETFDPKGLLFYNEKVLGPANVAYNEIIREEVELFFVNEQNLETTISNIKRRADQAILKD